MTNDVKPGTKPGTIVVMSYARIAEALVKANDLHEGIWRVCATFGSIGGLNTTVNGRLMLCAFVPIMEIGLMRDETLSELACDAAIVNPRDAVSRIWQ